MSYSVKRCCNTCHSKNIFNQWNIYKYIVDYLLLRLSDLSRWPIFNPLTPGGNKKVRHTLTNLQLKAAGLFEYVWPFCYHKALKGQQRFVRYEEFVGQIL